jgi:hypothetical protein
VEVPKLQQTSLTIGQEGEIGGRQRVKPTFVIDRRLGHAPSIPAGAASGLAPLQDLAKPILSSRPGSVTGVEDREAGRQGDRRSRIVFRRIDDANPASVQAAVRAAPEPALFADAVDDRTVNARPGERLERNASRRVEA